MQSARLATYLLHDASFALREGNVPSRLVADELNLNLTTLAATLLVIIIVIVGSAGALALDSTRFGGACTCAVADRLRVVELGRGRLVVLIRDVGHFARLALWFHKKLQKDKRLVEMLF